MSNTFNKRCYGIVIIKSEHSNWNADFTKFPRRLPDETGTIYATDKALKYAMRKYWVDDGQKVFVWKSFIEHAEKKKNSKEIEKITLIPRKLIERFQFMKDMLKVEGNELKDYKVLFEVFSQCPDVKLFGIAYAAEGASTSLTGSAQITYGVNRLSVNIPYSSDILAPYRDKDEKKSSTLGNEVRNLKSYYVYDFSVNPGNNKDHFQHIDDDAIKKNIVDKMSLTDGDIALFKEALNKAATNLNTTTKQGSVNALTLFITLKEGSKLQLPTMKNMVTVSEEGGVETIDISKINTLLTTYDDIESVELYGNNAIAGITGNDKWTINDILK